MSRKKLPRKSIRFELHQESPDEMRLFQHLARLAGKDEASDWIRETLIAALPCINSGTTVEQPLIKGVEPEIQVPQVDHHQDEQDAEHEPAMLPVLKRSNGLKLTDALNPNEVIRQRRIAAQAKQDTKGANHK